MENEVTYTCSCCGKIHEEWPAIAFDAPTSYSVLSDEMKESIGELDADFCVVHHPEQTDRFIRATISFDVVDHCDQLEYGIWVSLSEKSFEDYSDSYENTEHEVQYFGWLSNNIPEYEITESIPTTVFTQKGNRRPIIVPHENFDHQLVRDYYNGITKAEAEKRISEMLATVESRDTMPHPKKTWWKFWQKK